MLRRNCRLRHVAEGKIEGRIELMGRRGRRLTAPGLPQGNEGNKRSLIIER